MSRIGLLTCALAAALAAPAPAAAGPIYRWTATCSVLISDPDGPGPAPPTNLPCPSGGFSGRIGPGASYVPGTFVEGSGSLNSPFFEFDDPPGIGAGDRGAFNGNWNWSSWYYFIDPASLRVEWGWTHPTSRGNASTVGSGSLSMTFSDPLYTVQGSNLRVVLLAVPTPATLPLVGVALVALAGVARRRKFSTR
jgi:hypothetical protein